MSDRVLRLTYVDNDFTVWVGRRAVVRLTPGEAGALRALLGEALEPCPVYELPGGIDVLACAACGRPGWEHLSVRDPLTGKPRGWFPAETDMLKRLYAAPRMPRHQGSGGGASG